MAKYEDLTGRKFGRWVVIERSDYYNRNTIMWLCECVCGTKRRVAGISLRAGRTKSCGCLRIEQNAERFRGENHYNWKGGLSTSQEYRKDYHENYYKEHKGYLNRLSREYRINNLEYLKEYDRKRNKKRNKERQLKDDPYYIFSGLKRRSKHKNIPWMFTKEEFVEWYSQPKICHYCDRRVKRFCGKGKFNPDGISIDRKDNNGVYSKENCVLACYYCNSIKREIYTYKQMLKYGKEVLKLIWQSNAKKKINLIGGKL